MFRRTPSVRGGSAIDGRTTRDDGYQVSQRKRKRIEEVFGWVKTVGTLRKTRHRGLEAVAWVFTFTATAYNLVRMRNLIFPAGRRNGKKAEFRQSLFFSSLLKIHIHIRPNLMCCTGSTYSFHHPQTASDEFADCAETAGTNHRRKVRGVT